jgi:hypothetical protein
MTIGHVQFPAPTQTSRLRTVVWMCSLVVILTSVATLTEADESDFRSIDLPPFSDRLRTKPGRPASPSERPDQGATFPAFPNELLDRTENSSGSRRRVQPELPDDESAAPLDDRVPEMPEDPETRQVPPVSLPPTIATPGFDWTMQPVSVADVQTVRAWPFQHGTPNLTAEESAAYADLIRAALNRRGLIPAALPEDINTTTAWETAFYRYEDVRRQAWLHGNLSLQATAIQPVDPFAATPGKVLSTIDGLPEGTEIRDYSLQQDMQIHPADFTGRPVVLYGLFNPSGAVSVRAASTLENEQSEYVLQRGTLKSLSGRETLAILDAVSFVDPEEQSAPSTAWPVDPGTQIPVLVKGWFVKLWGQRPLIFTEVVRVVSPQPYDQYIREHVRSRRRISDDESWIYHETLRQLQVTSLTSQKQIALANQQKRVRQLLADMRQKAVADRRALEDLRKSGKLPERDEGASESFETRARRIQRQLAVRESRYAGWRSKPETFPVFVDLFQNPDAWQGQLVTVRGYVRRVMTHAGDRTLFRSQPLHELWLFTEDSQHIPTVIVTPSLPRDFPTDCDLIDSVTVTGCLLKMYVYRSQKDARLAPLLLAGHVEWAPSPQHVLDLVQDGKVAADSPLAAQARAADPRRINDTLVLMAGVLAVIVAMTVWGRVQRDRRQRERLLRLVDEQPDFHQTV